MNEALIYALSKRVEAGQMTIMQIPEVYREAVQELVNGGS